MNDDDDDEDDGSVMIIDDDANHPPLYLSDLLCIRIELHYSFNGAFW